MARSPTRWTHSPVAKVLLCYAATMGGLWVAGVVVPFASWLLPVPLV
jgi:hypothetical protein